MNQIFQNAQMLIKEEYSRLCKSLGLSEVPLDIYIHDDKSELTVKTPLGISFRNATPAYLDKKCIIAFPLLENFDCPATLSEYPPSSWIKQGDQWPAWRIDLWHEVAHQASHELYDACNPKEPGRIRSDGTRSEMGHGTGWFKGVSHVANHFGVMPEDLENLLNR
jgi:hypothetical protein